MIKNIKETNERRERQKRNERNTFKRVGRRKEQDESKKKIPPSPHPAKNKKNTDACLRSKFNYYTRQQLDFEEILKNRREGPII